MMHGPLKVKLQRPVKRLPTIYLTRRFKKRTATTSLIQPVRSSLRMKQGDSHRTDFNENSQLKFFTEICRHRQILVRIRHIKQAFDKKPRLHSR